MPPPTGVVSGPLMPTQVLAERLDRFVRQPAVRLLEALLAGVDFHPGDLLLAAVRLLDRRVEHAHAGAPDVGAGAVAFDERDDRIVGHDELAVPPRDRCSASSAFANRRMELGICDLGQVPRRRENDFTQKLWKTLWKSAVRFTALLRCNSECFSGLHHSRATAQISGLRGTKTFGLYCSDRADTSCGLRAGRHVAIHKACQHRDS